MKQIAMLRCYHCHHSWTKKKKDGLPLYCPNCGREDWQKPTFLYRIKQAIEAFKCPPRGEVKHREIKQQLKLDDVLNETNPT